MNHIKNISGGSFTFSLFLLCLILVNSALADTTVCGEIKSPTDWIKSKSPYIVTNDVHVPMTSRLAIEPGVVVRFTEPRPCADRITLEDKEDSAFTGIKVDGPFFIRGTEAQPVVFEPFKKSKGLVLWDGIRINHKTSFVTDIGGAVFRGANRALQIRDSRFEIKNCIFESNNTGVYLFDASNVSIINCNFIGNKSAGVYISGSNPEILNCIFAGNLFYGIWSDSRASIKINYNAFWDNADEHCFKCPAGTLVLSGKNLNEDSVDAYNNLIADPVFKGTPSHNKAVKDDITLNTSEKNVQDKKMAQMEWENQKNWRKKKPKKQEFVFLGVGPYLLTKYSSLINAGHPSDLYQDRDGTVNDIGIHGGQVVEVKAAPVDSIK
jgi:parallel beta-helix repeat protein